MTRFFIINKSIARFKDIIGATGTPYSTVGVYKYNMYFVAPPGSFGRTGRASEPPLTKYLFHSLMHRSTLRRTCLNNASKTTLFGCVTKWDDSPKAREQRGSPSCVLVIFHFSLKPERYLQKWRYVNHISVAYPCLAVLLRHGAQHLSLI